MTSALYEAISQRYSTLFADIARGERAREAGRHLPLVPLKQLTDQGFGAITVPAEAGGDGANYQTAFRILMDLAAVDANLAHIWRSHLAFIEYLRLIPDEEQRNAWWQRILEGQWGGSALSSHDNPEPATMIKRDPDATLRITGQKYYTTGTLASEWTVVSASLEESLAEAILRRRRRAGESGLSLHHVKECLAVIRVRQPRVQVKDDWDGFGQRMTATGTLTMRDAGVETILNIGSQHVFVPVFHEISLAALIVGIGRAALRDGTAALRERTRIFNTSTGQIPRYDSEMLGIIGQLSAQLGAAEEMVRATGRELDARHLSEATLQSQRASVMVPHLVLDVCTRIFDTLGASATSTGQELDRHWRNARTLATHDPAVFKQRMLGDWEVNGVMPTPFISTNHGQQLYDARHPAPAVRS
ncbi:MAG TPA: acyl-CoA dehydrogenase family protein [Enteractinococcus sp.]